MWVSSAQRALGPLAAFACLLCVAWTIAVILFRNKTILKHVGIQYAVGLHTLGAVYCLLSFFDILFVTWRTNLPDAAPLVSSQAWKKWLFDTLTTAFLLALLSRMMQLKSIFCRPMPMRTHTPYWMLFAGHLGIYVVVSLCIEVLRYANYRVPGYMLGILGDVVLAIYLLCIIVYFLYLTRLLWLANKSGRAKLSHSDYVANNVIAIGYGIYVVIFVVQDIFWSVKTTTWTPSEVILFKFFFDQACVYGIVYLVLCILLPRRFYGIYQNEEKLVNKWIKQFAYPSSGTDSEPPQAYPRSATVVSLPLSPISEPFESNTSP